MSGRNPGTRLDRPELAPLVDELVRRYGDGPPPTTITLRNLTTDQRGALADLLGDARLPAMSPRVGVARLERVLGLTEPEQLRAVLEQLRGPIVDRRAFRAAEDAARGALWTELESQAIELDLFGTESAAAAWVAGLRRRGIRRGIERYRARLQDAVAVLRVLPADGVPLAAVAHDVLGDPHALDSGRTVAGMVLDAIATAADCAPATDAETTRMLWESVGVAPDLLSSTVLVLGLRADKTHPLGPYLSACADGAEPVVLTLAQLRRWPLAALSRAEMVFVVENPSVVAEAARQAWSGPVLVCSSGRPTVAVVTLLRQLGADGAVLYQHADFDPAGLSITAWLADRAGTIPWRMSTSDYSARLATARVRRGLKGAVPPTDWDPCLGGAITLAGVAIFEEELRSSLLASMLGPHHDGQETTR